MIDDFAKFVEEAENENNELNDNVNHDLPNAYNQILNLFHALTATVDEDYCIKFDLTNDERNGSMGSLDGCYAYPALKDQLNFELDNLEDVCKSLVKHINSMRERLTALDEYRNEM